MSPTQSSQSILMTCPLNGRLWTLLTVAVYHLLLHYPLVTNDQVSIIENAPAGASGCWSGKYSWQNIGTHTGTKKQRRNPVTKNLKNESKKLSGTKKAAIQDNKTQMAASADSPTSHLRCLRSLQQRRNAKRFSTLRSGSPPPSPLHQPW